MGLQQSKDQLLYQQVRIGNIKRIKDFHRIGASLEWKDKEGYTPLILASMNPIHYNVAKTLLELGANVNYYRPCVLVCSLMHDKEGCHSETALHHAAKKGLEQMVKLLLLHGASALLMNDDGQTALDVARLNGYSDVVRAIENHICLFSGWLRALYIVPGFAQPPPRKVWVVIVRCGARKLTKPFKLELVIYSGLENAKPHLIIPLWKAYIDEPNFNQPDPSVIISISNKETYIVLAPVNENENQQLKRFCNACREISPIRRPQFSFNIQASGIRQPAQITKNTNPITQNKEKSQWQNNDAGTSNNSVNYPPPTVPSAPPISDIMDDDLVHYLSIDSTLIEKEKENKDSSTCVICLDAPIEGVCIPCGHMAGCMSCLEEVKGKNWGCPVCRTKIDQVVRVYAV